MIFVPLCVFIAVAGYGWVKRSRWMVIAFGCIPAALLTYYLLGMGTALAIGEGHFYSVPFGGFSVGGSDAALGGSILFWLVVWLGILAICTRKFTTPSP